VWQVAALTFFLLFLAPLARSVCLDSPRLICAEFLQSQVVVEAKLVHEQHIVPEHAQDGSIYRLVTSRVLRGRIDPTFRVSEENGSGCPPFGWKRGEQYLLFLKPSGNGNGYLDGCGNSTPLVEAAPTLKVIESLEQRRKGGLIQGKVLAFQSKLGSRKGVKIQIFGNGRKYEMSTDDLGGFNVHVPAGEYKANAIREGWVTSADVLTYEDPNNIKIENGGCAQIQFGAVEKN
jgi:hypothetical protein